MVNAMLIWSISSNANSGIAPQPAQASGTTINPKRSEILIVRLAFHSPAERDRLAAAWGAEEINTLSGYLTVWTDRAGYNKMLAAGLQVTIDQQTTNQANNPYLFGSNSPDTFYGGYKTVEEMQTFLDQKVAAYPTLAVKVNIGPSWCMVHPNTCTVPAGGWNGYNIYALHITNQNIAGPKPVYWYDAAIHAREIAVPEVAMRYIDYLLNNYNSDADAHWLVDYHDIWVVPMANPDGHHIVEQGESEGYGSPYYQRKNANNTNGCTVYPPSPSNQYGTDNNRNFSFQWGLHNGSSGAACDQTYRGASAASDPETLAIQNKVSSLIPQQRIPDLTHAAPLTTTGVYQNMHSSASLDLYPWGWGTNNPAPNSTELANIAAHISASNAYPSGNSYQACQPGDCLYSVDGDAFDWAYGQLGAAAFTTEIDGGFFATYSYIDSTIWPDNKGALLYEAKIARTPYMIAYGPDAVTASGTPITVTQGSLAPLAASINYAWSSNGLAQNVGAAEYYLDTPPWAGGIAVPMSGTFGTQTVAVSANIDTTAIATGRHILFVRGRGVNNIPATQYQSWGAISAQFLDITPAGGATPTPTNTSVLPTVTPTASSTPAPTNTLAPPTSTPVITSTSTPAITATNTPVITSTATPGTPSPTPTDCPNPFVDVTANIFYHAIHTLNCAGAINGTDATHFSPAGTSSRGQFAKVVVLGFGTPLYTPTTQDFVDVPPSYFAYAFIESGFHAGILSGYDPATCAAHGLGTPCYLPNLPITRGQLTKLVVNAGGYTLITPIIGGQDFQDVPPNSTFYTSIETAYHNGIVNGYPCGTPPAGACVPPTNLPYFLSLNNIRRDQMAQIVYEGIIHRP